MTYSKTQSAKMKKTVGALLIISIILCSFGCGSSKDQVKADPQAKKESKKASDSQEQMEVLISKLYLIGSQEDQFRAVQEKYVPKVEKAMRERNIEAVRSLRDQQLAEIKSILSETQYEAFEEEMKRQANERRGIPTVPK
jgi:hypothetical protein